MQSLVKCLFKKCLPSCLCVWEPQGKSECNGFFYCPVIDSPDIVSPSVATRQLLLLSEASAKSADHVSLFCLSLHFSVSALMLFSFIVSFFFLDRFNCSFKYKIETKNKMEWKLLAVILVFS